MGGRLFVSKHMVYHHHNLQLAILVSPVLSVADDVLSSSQYCTKPYSKENLTDEEILFNYYLFTK